MIHLVKPEEFNPKMEVVGNFVRYNGKIILLHRQDHKSEGNTWGIPSGKIDPGEDMFNAMQRETQEETGILIPRGNLKFFQTAYVKFDSYDFVYHMFSSDLNEETEIKINASEHKDAIWISPGDALDLALIEDLDTCIKLFFEI